MASANVPFAQQFFVLTDLTQQQILIGYRNQNSDLELYKDYFLTFGAATATGLSAMFDGDINHERLVPFPSTPVQ
jgi:hypothetical protein